MTSQRSTLRQVGVSAPALVGREAELATLTQVLGCPPAVVLVEGEAGIGKTRLISELQARPEFVDRRFLVGACRRIREPFPLGPVLEAVRRVGDALPLTGLSPVAGSLRPLLPELADLLPPQPARLDDREAERHRVFRGLVEVLGALGPAVVVFEDLHWTDEQTVDFVAYLLGDPPPTLSLVLTFRGEEVDPSVRALAATAPAGVSRANIVLEPLDVGQTRELAEAILGVDVLSAEFVSYLCERTSGLPFAIEEVLALLQARGTLVRRSDGGWARRTLEELDVPAGIRDPVLERLSRVSADARSVMEAAAVLQIPTPPDVLLAACPITASRAKAGVLEALESGLLIETSGRIAYRHVLAAQTVYGHLLGPRREGLHSQAASALEALERPPLGQIAHHLRHARRMDEWVDAAEEVADQAIELGHDTEAARLLEEMLRHAPLGVEERGRIAVKLGRAATDAGRGRDVLELLSGVLETDKGMPHAVRGELQLWLAMLMDRTDGDLVVMDRLLAGAVEELGERPDLQAWALVARGLPRTPGVRLSDHLEWLHRSLDLLPKVEDPVFEVFLLGKVAMALTAVGDPEWRSVADRIVQRSGGAPRHRRDVSAYYSVGLEACYSGHYERADQLLTAGLEGAAFCESRYPELSIRAASCVLDYCRGSWEGLDGRVEALLDEPDRDPSWRTDVDPVAGGLALARGELDEAGHILTKAMHGAEVRGSFDVLPLSAGLLLRLALARGDVNDAVAVVERVLAVIELKEIWAVTARALPPIARALVAAERVADARTIVADFDTALHNLDAPLAPAAIRHAQGIVKSATGERGGAAKHFRAAAELYQHLLCPYEAAQAREQAAASLLPARDATAEELLRSALVTYRELGATWDFGRAASLARQHGISVPAGHRGGRRGYGDRLSPRELAVAELAAAGRTNKEIASELFLSSSTVKQHVSAAMQKLGVRSRTVLADHLPFGAQETTAAPDK